MTIQPGRADFTLPGRANPAPYDTTPMTETTHASLVPPPEPWRQCLYSSRLAGASGWEVFPRLVQRSRVRNASESIGGCLLFDGQRFCQLIEGPAPAVSALWRRVGGDPRHGAIILLLDRALPAPAEPGAWEYGYCSADELECFDGPAVWHGLDALAIFEAVRARADLAR